jgi:hypothetical protein
VQGTSSATVTKTSATKAPAAARTGKATKPVKHTTGGGNAGKPAGSAGGGAKSPDAGTHAAGGRIPAAGGGAPGTPSVIRDTGKEKPDDRSGDPTGIVKVPMSPPAIEIPADPVAAVEKVGTQVDPTVGSTVGDVRDVLGH